MSRHMTEEEAEALSDYYTKYPPEVDLTAPYGGYFTERRKRWEAEMIAQGKGDVVLADKKRTEEMLAAFLRKVEIEELTAASPRPALAQTACGATA